MRLVHLLLVLLVLAVLPPPSATASACAGGPANDCIEDALEWFATPERYTTLGATMEPGEPSCGGTQNSVWLRLEVQEPGTWDRFTVHLGADHHSTFAAYTRASDGTLTMQDCSYTTYDDDLGGWNPPGALSLACSPGAVYYIQVGTLGSQLGGPFSILESQFLHFNRTTSAPCPFKHTLPGAPSVWLEPGARHIGVVWHEGHGGGRGVPNLQLHVYGADTCDGPFVRLASKGGISPRWGGPGAYGSWDESGLANGAARCYRVSGENYLGEGALSAPLSATTWVLSGAPRLHGARPAGDGELSLSWSPPTSTGGGPVTGYVLDRTDAQGVTTRVATTPANVFQLVDTGLARGATYTYALHAVTAVGQGEAARSTGTTWAIVGAPRDLTVTSGLTPAPELSWSAPEGDAPFLTYRIYRVASNGATTLVDEVGRATTSYRDNGVLLATTSTYEVRAWNPAGEGAPSARACDTWPVSTPVSRC